MSARQQDLLSDGQDLAGISDIAVRHGFIRKVFGILSCQLIVTTLIGGLITIKGDDMIRDSPGLVLTLAWSCMALTIAMMFVFICCPGTMRKSPLNYVLLSSFTLAEGVMVGFICVQYTVPSVLVTLAFTAMITLAIKLFSCQTKYDFTGMMPYLMVCSLVLCGFGFLMMIVSLCGGGSSQAFQTVNMIYAAMGALVFSAYIVLDTQLIVGGKAKHRFSVDDYCMAAINIYVDIIQLFLYLLQLFGDRRN